MSDSISANFPNSGRAGEFMTFVIFSINSRESLFDADNLLIALLRSERLIFSAKLLFLLAADRFCLLPDQLKNLFAISELKLTADTLGIIKIDASSL